ncbi:MAG: hypothetical protein H0V80_03705, partial [Acidobacteria bacterium]|nr:hypothetical protein [Acidobacteriota bacterium]
MAHLSLRVAALDWALFGDQTRFAEVIPGQVGEGRIERTQNGPALVG